MRYYQIIITAVRCQTNNFKPMKKDPGGHWPNLTRPFFMGFLVGDQVTAGKRLNIVSGDKFGRLTVLHELPSINWKRYFLCICSFGNKKRYRLDSLNTGRTTSCGCYSREIIIERNTKHGQHDSRLYTIWRGMKIRCLNSNSPSYNNYGGRGISICHDWLCFDVFHVWATTNGYLDDLTIERIDNDGNYEPGNCTWITPREQSKNTRKSIKVTINGENFKTLTDAAIRYNIKPSVAYSRYYKGLPIEQVLGVE